MDADKGAGSTLNVANIRCSTMLRGLHTRLPCLYYRAPLRASFYGYYEGNYRAPLRGRKPDRLDEFVSQQQLNRGFATSHSARCFTVRQSRVDFCQ